MKVTYDPDVDVLRILLHSGPVEESDESKPGLILDYDKAGNVIGLEILDASRRTDNPRAMEYAIAEPLRRNKALAVACEGAAPEYVVSQKQKKTRPSTPGARVRARKQKGA